MNNEPVAWMETYKGEPNNLDWDKNNLYCEGEFHNVVPLYTHPVKELTDEEITACIDESEPDTTDMIRFARAILRKAQEADKIESLGTVNIGGVHFKNGKEVK